VGTIAAKFLVLIRLSPTKPGTSTHPKANIASFVGQRDALAISGVSVWG
jgi:hypothetical protein